MGIKRLSAHRTAVFAVFLAVGLSACGGAKVLKEPEPLEATASLANSADQRLGATIEWVIVRDGPGIWAKNADWDEYRISVRNLSGESIQITSIAIQDSLGTLVAAGENRKQLVKGAKQTKRRYKSEGLKVKAGMGMGTMLAAGAVSAAGTATIVGGGVLSMSTTGAAAATGGLILVPVFVIGGTMRGVNNNKVNKQIESRQTVLPIELQGQEEKNLNTFFPLVPSPRYVEITYVDSAGIHTLDVDTRTVLDGLHLANAEGS